MKIAEHYQGTYGGFPTPEFVFHIGPKKGNTLASKEDFSRRTEDVQRLLTPGSPDFTVLAKALEKALGVKVERLHAQVRMGGWKGTICPNLCINSIRSTLATGGIIFSQVTPEVGKALSQSLMEVLEADWVACQHYFGKPFQVECLADREGGDHAEP